MSNRILVTGGAGFIGSHLVDKLIVQGYQVTVLDNLSSGLRKNVNPQADFVYMDITSPDLLPLLVGESFNCVFHLAAQTKVQHSLSRPGEDCQVNIQGTVNLLEACRGAGIRRIVFSSTAAVYGDVTAIPVQETASLDPTSFYGQSKLVAEKYLAMYATVFGLEYVILRYANVYGPRQGGDGEGGVVAIFAENMVHNQPLVIFGDGSQTRDFIFVGDVVSANLRALTTTVSNRVYNISTGEETSIQNLAANLAQFSSRQVKFIYQKARIGDIHRSALANQAAKRELGWTPQVSLEDGLFLTYRALAEKGETGFCSA